MQKYQNIGENLPIRDAALKVTGQKQYVGDMFLPDMLYGEVLFSTVPHGRIKRIDTSKAKALPGVRAVLTYEDDPGVVFNSAIRFYEHQLINTEHILNETVRYVGDRVAAVAADTRAIAQQAIKLIEVEYEELPYYTDVEKAMEEGTYPIHGESNIIATIEHTAGNPEEGFAQADRIFEGRYTTQPIHHAAIEHHVALAHCDASGKLTVYTGNQNTFSVRILLSRIFGKPLSRIRVVSPGIGGAFGGKLESTVEPVAALLTLKTGKPVRVEYSREACINSTRTRHGSVVYIKTGVKNDGTIVAQNIHVITNTGAYAGSCMNVMGALSHKVFKVYKCPNMHFKGQPVYTNTPEAGAMRGYGSPQAFFGQQRQFNEIAKALGMSAEEFQLKNLVDPDALDPIGFYSLGNPHVKDCVLRAHELMKNWEKIDTEGGKYRVGVGMAVGAHGCGCFGAHRDQICVMIKMNEDGTCVYYTGSHEMGNGSVTAQLQVVSNVLKMPLEAITCVEADTDAVPWNLGDYSSHGVFVGCSAAKKTAETTAQELLKEASLLMKEPVENLELVEMGVRSKVSEAVVSLCDVVVHAQAVSHREIICQESHVMSNGPTAYGVHFARVKVNMENGNVQVTDYVAVHDVGKVINRMGIEGQLEGAIPMGIGYALYEGLHINEAGVNDVDDLVKYHIPHINEMPKIQVDFIEAGEPGGPFGAKSIGEASVVPAAPAVMNAVVNALNVEINDLPYRWGGGVKNKDYYLQAK